MAAVLCGHLPRQKLHTADVLSLPDLRRPRRWGEDGGIGFRRDGHLKRAEQPQRCVALLGVQLGIGYQALQHAPELPTGGADH
jgi:hypothetical protein